MPVVGTTDSSPTDPSPYIGHLSSSPLHGPDSDLSHGEEFCFSPSPEAASSQMHLLCITIATRSGPVRKMRGKGKKYGRGLRR